MEGHPQSPACLTEGSCGIGGLVVWRLKSQHTKGGTRRWDVSDEYGSSHFLVDMRGPNTSIPIVLVNCCDYVDSAMYHTKPPERW